MTHCTVCPRRCGAGRTNDVRGRCGAGTQIRIASAGLHFWEEPPVSGDCGSGAIFFSYCPLQCVYCQNAQISRGGLGEDITVERLVDLMLRLQSRGAANINLVTGSHYALEVAAAVHAARRQGMCLPVVWNSSGYETIDTLDTIADAVDVFLPDFKYWSSDLARDFSGAADYPQVASAAVQHMVQLQPDTVFDRNGMIRRGVIIRHLVLPDHTRDSKNVLSFLQATFGTDVWVSVMRQYTPPGAPMRFPELNRPLRAAEYASVVRYAEQLGLENVFIQECGSVGAEFIPHFSAHVGDFQP